MKIKIYQEPVFNAISFTFYEERNGKIYVAKPVEIIMEELTDEFKPLEPTIRLSQYETKEFLKSMANEVYNNGIRHDQDVINEGALVSTKYHLEDLRKLLKLN
jgi:hypothetical protein